jgi:hypothetical protein
MANIWNHHKKHPALEQLLKLHVNAGISDLMRRKYRETVPDTSGVIETISTDVGAAVRIRATSCNYGGFRYWIVCDGCHKNRLVLRYIEEEPHKGLYCNNCLNAVHQSTQLSKSSRRYRRRANIREQLGLKRQHGLRDSIYSYHRPKGMHYSTFFRLQDKHNRLIREDTGIWIAASLRMFPGLLD